MNPRHRDICAAILTAAIVLLPILLGRAVAASYPVSGRWTYDAGSGKGPAKDCGKRYMEFNGGQRIDTGGGVPGYRNLSVSRVGNDYRLVDEFNTGQIRARESYTLRILDEDRIELKLSRGQTVTLRRCG